MYGVIDFLGSSSGPILFTYDNLSSAISAFSEVKDFLQYRHDNSNINIVPNVNRNLILLAKSDEYCLPNVDEHYLPEDNVVNIGILRIDHSSDWVLACALLDSIEHILDILGNYYQIRSFILCDETCIICKCNFKVSSQYGEYRSCFYYGCVYNPTYYRIMSLELLKHYLLPRAVKDQRSQPETLKGSRQSNSWHLICLEGPSPSQLRVKIVDRLDFDIHPSKIFFIVACGGAGEIYLAKFSRPNGWNGGSVICWNCIETMMDRIVQI
ncbi:Hypothetical protein HVR_LOCUS728 [uncultured virus]|nr:Hypothetical protein HVR_LOCUS728 [uncultured virus]